MPVFPAMADTTGSGSNDATQSTSASGQQPWMNANQTPDQRADELLAQMTLAEKVQIMHGITSDGHHRYVPPIPRLGIPPLVVTNGPVGVGPSDVYPQPPATAFPAAISMAASFDTDLVKEEGALAGKEAKQQGNSLLEAPDINIVRLPQGGRTFESYTEDPYLDGQLAAANIQGIQSQGEIADLKHFDANNQESDRFGINEIIDDRTLHEIYLPGFETGVEQGHPGAVMSAYPKINGMFSSENPFLLTQSLKEDWNFNGMVTSDFGAAHSTAPSLNAGLDLEMPSGKYYTYNNILAALQSGQVKMATINDHVHRILRTYFSFGLFDHPDGQSPVDVQGDGAAALKMAEQGTVLLKNENNILPLLNSVKSIAVIGPDAGKAMTGGGGSSHVVPYYTVTPLQGIQKRAGSNVNVNYADGSDLTAAANAASSSDVAVVFVGDSDSEGHDRNSTLDLDKNGTQDQLIQAVAKANKNTIVVLNTGGPVVMPWLDQVQGVVEAWYPGEEDGNAIAAILFGDVNPSGKLPVTFPKQISDAPANTQAQWPGVLDSQGNQNAYYSEGLFVGYRHYDQAGIQPLFPFGYGLSYTNFSFSNLTVSKKDINSLGKVDVAVTVTNTGQRAGAEVVQMYLGDPASTGEPIKQLKGFQKVNLAPGQSTRVHFTVDSQAMSYWDTTAGAWSVADGTYKVYVGDSSENLPLQDSFDVNATTGAQTMKVDAPAAFAPNVPTTVTTTFTTRGEMTLHGVRVALHAPAGWQVEPVTNNVFGSVEPNQAVTTTWKVTAPLGAQDSLQQLNGTVDFAEANTANDSSSAAVHNTVTVNVQPAVTAASPASPTAMQAGATADASLTLTNTTNQPLTVNWSSDPTSDAGFAVTPGSVALNPGESKTVHVSTAVDASVASGNHTVAVGLNAVDAAGQSYVLPTSYVAVTTP